MFFEVIGPEAQLSRERMRLEVEVYEEWMRRGSEDIQDIQGFTHMKQTPYGHKVPVPVSYILYCYNRSCIFNQL